MIRCVDCKFYRYLDGRCRRRITHVVVPDPVRGGVTEKDTSPFDAFYTYAAEERRSRLPWKCGMKARHFVEAPRVIPGLLR